MAALQRSHAVAFGLGALLVLATVAAHRHTPTHSDAQLDALVKEKWGLTVKEAENFKEAGALMLR